MSSMLPTEPGPLPTELVMCGVTLCWFTRKGKTLYLASCKCFRYGNQTECSTQKGKVKLLPSEEFDTHAADSRSR